MEKLFQRGNFTFIFMAYIFVAFLAYMQPSLAYAEVDSSKVATFEQALDIQEAGLSPLGKYIDNAKNLYFKTFTAEDSQETRDAAFMVFHKYYAKIITEINKGFNFDGSFDSIQAQRTEAEKLGLQYGYKIGTRGEGTFAAEEDTDYLLKTFAKNISTPFVAYFTFAKKSRNYAFDGGLSISHEELRKLIILGDDIVKKYPDFKTTSLVEAILKKLVSSYMLGLDNTPVYGGKRILLPEVKKSLENFLKENKQSTYYPLVKYSYDLLKRNGFKMTDKVYADIVKKLREIKVLPLI